MPNPYASKSKTELKAGNVNMEETSGGVVRGLDRSETTSELTPHLNHYPDVPEGNIESVMTWVGDDVDRAQRALDSEENHDKPRKTLIERLKEMIDG